MINIADNPTVRELLEQKTVVSEVATDPQEPEPVEQAVVVAPYPAKALTLSNGRYRVVDNEK